MWQKNDPDNVFEWTVGETGFEDTPKAEESPTDMEPAAPAPAMRRSLHIPWRAATLPVIVPTVLILLSVWAWGRWNQWQTRHEVEQILSAEKTAPPSPLGYLKWDETEPARVGVITQLDVNTLRADAIYTFRAPDGKQYRFAVPRFFRRAGESWQPADPPTSFPGELRELTNPRLTLYYRAADAELVEQKLLPYLNATLERVCTRWRCTKPATLRLIEPRARQLTSSGFSLEADEPLLFWLLAGTKSQSLVERMRLVAAPSTAGYPVDAASTELWQRTLALQAFSQLALDEFFAQTPPGYFPESLFLPTLISLEAANYALESPAVREYGLEAETVSPLLLRRLPEFGQYPEPIEQAQQRRALLAFINRFARRWPEAEPLDLSKDVLFARFGPGPISWMLGRSLRDGQPLTEWANQWRELLGEPASMVELPSGNLLLHCFTGPQIYGEEGLKPLLSLAGLPVPAYSFAGWSPTGRYLPLGIGYRATVLDTETGLIRLPPDDTDAAYHMPLAWASDTVLAYIAIKPAAVAGRGMPDLDANQLRLFEVTEPAHRLPSMTNGGELAIPGVFDYLPSPDRRWAALARAGNTEGDPQSTLELMPALGGERKVLAQEALSPAWSPDSRELAFLEREPSSSSAALRIYNVSTGQSRIVWKSQAAERATVWAQLAWSPDGQWIALAAHTADSNSLRWFGLVAPDGSNTIRLDAPGDKAGNDGSQRFQSLLPESVINAMAFSQNGRYLALTGAFPEPQLLIYDLMTGRIVQTLTIGPWGHLQWSPDDRQLLLSGNGVALLEEPLNAQSQPRLLADGENCFSASWKP